MTMEIAAGIGRGRLEPRVGTMRRGLATRLRALVPPALSFGDQGFSSVCNFLTTVLLTRSLGLETFGHYAMIWLGLYLAMSLQLGLIVSPMMSIGPKRSGRDADSYYGVVFVHQLAFLTLVGACTFVALGFAARSVPEFEGAAWAGVAAGVTYLMQDFLRRYLFARRRPGAVLFIDIVNQGVKLAALLLLWREGQAGLVNALWAVSAAAAASIWGGLILSGPLRWRPRGFVATTARQWRSARWLVLTGSVQWILAYSGLVVTAALLGPTVLGALRAAQSLLAVMNVVREAMENVVPPLAGRALSEGGLRGLRRTILWATIFAAAIGTVAVIGLALFGADLLRLLYGGEILAFDWVIGWYALVFPMALVNLVLGCAFRALERTRPIFSASLIAACFNLAAIYPAATLFGVAGIIAVTLLSELLVLITLSLLVRGMDLFGRADAAPAAATGRVGGLAS